MLLASASNFNLLIILIFTTIAIQPNDVTGRIINGDDDEYKNDVTTQNNGPVQKIEKVIENSKDWVLKEADNLVLEIEDVVIPYSIALSKTIGNEVKISIGQLKKYFGNLQSNAMGNCTCHSYTCGCCIQPDVPEIHLHSKLCSNISYLPDDYGFTFTITLDSHVLVNKTISVHNPPPICVTPPYVEKLIDLCLRFFNVNASKTNLHACVQVELGLKGLILAHYDLGCYDVGPKAIEESVYYEVKLI